jgi:hypothetical protein
MTPSIVQPPLRSVEHEGSTFVIYKNGAGLVEVDEEKVLWIFKFKRYLAGNAKSTDVVVEFPTKDRVSCLFRPSGRKFVVDAHSSLGAGLLETWGFRHK